MELRQLRSFLTVAGTLNYHRAAQQLAISQPALTRQIQQLEESLNTQLFTRDKRRVELTPSGSYLLRRGTELVAFADRITGEIRQAWKAGEETLSLGYTEAVMASFLPAMLSKLKQMNPAANLRLSSGHSDFLEGEVAGGRLDAALVSLQSDRPELACAEVATETMGVVLPEGHPLARQKQVSLKSIRDETLILFSYADNPRLYTDILLACQQSGFTPRHIEESDSRILAVNMVVAGLGVALLSEKLAHYCREGAIFRPLAQPRPQIHFYLIQTADQQHPLIRQLQQVM
ncbi:MAG: LysR family transcriptional regulator [Verrucomicrobiota bacterium]